MTQVHLTVALTLDTGLPQDRAILARLLASDPRETPPIKEPAENPPPPAQDEPPAEEAPAPSAATVARQAAAAKARAAKAAKQAAPVPPGSLAEDVAGPGTDGLDPDTSDDMGLDNPSMSPTEARDAGLAVVREIYAAGKVTEVKMLQKHYGVAKFYDVPEARGHEFHRHVLDVARSVGLRP